MLHVKKCVNGAYDSQADSLIHICNKYGVALLLAVTGDDENYVYAVAL
jgi:hypothetical protein